jgi:hypothetical protein
VNTSTEKKVNIVKMKWLIPVFDLFSAGI